MRSSETIDRYYYIFDGRAQRTLVVDRSTGEEVAWESQPRVQLIDYVSGEASSGVSRQFARWCARQTGVSNRPEDSAVGRLWRAVCNADPFASASIRREMAHEALRAASLGLPQRSPEAAQLLTVHACTHPDRRQAAIDAAHMSERWAEFEADTGAASAAEEMRQRHVDWLLDVLRRS